MKLILEIFVVISLCCTAFQVEAANIFNPCEGLIVEIISSDVEQAIDQTINANIKSNQRKHKRLQFLEFAFDYYEKNNKFLSASAFTDKANKNILGDIRSWQSITGSITPQDDIKVFSSPADFYFSFIMYTASKGKILNDEALKGLHARSTNIRNSEQEAIYEKLVSILKHAREKKYLSNVINPKDKTLSRVKLIHSIYNITPYELKVTRNSKYYKSEIKQIDIESSLPYHNKDAKTVEATKTLDKTKKKVGAKKNITIVNSRPKSKGQGELVSIKDIEEILSSTSDYAFDTRTNAIASAVSYFNETGRLLTITEFKNNKSLGLTKWAKMTKPRKSIKTFNSSSEYYVLYIATLIKLGVENIPTHTSRFQVDSNIRKFMIRNSPNIRKRVNVNDNKDFIYSINKYMSEENQFTDADLEKLMMAI